MLLNNIRLRSTLLVSATLVLVALSANAQTPQRRIPKLDAALSVSVRTGKSDTTRVIIRTNPDGIPRLTNALKATGPIRRVHSGIHVVAHIDGRRAGCR